MPTITLQEQRQVGSGQFEALLQFENGGTYTITVQDPFDAAQEAKLEWYFEGWIRRPFLNTVTAGEAAQSILTYGEALFDQIFHDRRAYGEYLALRSQLGQVQIAIASQSPEFQALHWEALKDPDLPRPLALDCVMVRKPLQPGGAQAQLLSSPTLNLLVVTARPDEEKDVNYRTISRPLIEAIQQARVPVQVELLRPGTYEALEKHLEEKGTGYYHIIHFDAHGGLATYEQITQEQEQERLFFQQRYGRHDIQPYDGVKAYLFLEGETPGKADPVEAGELASLLINRGIPVCILNACQSAKQLRTPPTPNSGGSEPSQSPPELGDLGGQKDWNGAHFDLFAHGSLDKGGEDSRETSLASCLMTAGMQMVVAMGYSVSVTAAEVLMQALYQELFAQKPLAEAIRLGRRELHNRKTRRGWFNYTVDLEDWLLPVVYANRSVTFDLQPMPGPEQEAYYEAMGSQYRFTQPTYGFVGRDLEILKIEKSLLRHNALLLRGMGGTGKTTLLNYLREWWQTTHFAKGIFYFGYDERAWTLAQIVHEIGKRVYDRFEQATFQAMGLQAQAMKLATLLNGEPYVLMLDNLESVTGEALAIQNTLPAEEQATLRDFLQRLVGGKTRVVLGSRSGEEWLAAVFNGNRYTLPGLDPESRSMLAERILERHVKSPQRIEALRKEEAFEKLMKLLAGYPLAMEVVLANLVKQTPEEILAGLDAADVRLDTGSEDKTQSILKCVEYSHSNLSPEAQKLLLCLAPFQGFIDWQDLPQYAKHLKQFEPFQTYSFEHFDQAVQEAINWGLLSPMSEETPQLLTLQPVFPYFLKTKLTELDDASREALQAGFRTHYQSLAGMYQQLMQSNNSQERHLGMFFVEQEYENLYAALKSGLSSFTAGVLSIQICLNIYLEQRQDKKSQFELAQEVYLGLEKYPANSRSRELELSLLGLTDLLALGYLQNHNFEKAQEFYEKSLELVQGRNDLPREVQQGLVASTYHQMGILAQTQRQWEAAQAYYQKALDIFIELRDRASQGSTYHQMGILAQTQRQWEAAQTNYQKALDIFIELRDRHEQADTYHQMGRVAQAQGQWEAAQTYYQKALDIFTEFDNHSSQAGTYHQMGVLAQAQGQWEDAQVYYQKALDIFIEFGNHSSQAGTYHQMGVLAQTQEQWEAAQVYYQRALDIKIKYVNRYSQASTYNQMGTIARVQGLWEDAQAYYQKALDIFIEFNDLYEQGVTYHQMGRLAEEKENYVEARTNFQKALEIFIEFNDEDSLSVVRESLKRLDEKIGRG